MVPANVVLDYCHRSQASKYDKLLLWEHTEWVCKITKKSEIKRIAKHVPTSNRSKLRRSQRFRKTNGMPGRKMTARGDFNWRKHPNYTTHTNRFREVLFVPVMFGQALPRCDRGPEEKEQWCRAMTIIFKPWRQPSDLKEDDQSWTNAFEAARFHTRISKIIKNMNVENECKDARDSYNHRKRSGAWWHFLVATEGLLWQCLIDNWSAIRSTVREISSRWQAMWSRCSFVDTVGGDMVD